MKYLIKVSVALAKRRDTVEVIMLDNMIGRLCELLTEDAKSALLDDLTDLDKNTTTLYWLVTKMKGSRMKCSDGIYKFDDLPRAFLDLQKHPTTHNWKHLVRRRLNNFLIVILFWKSFVQSFLYMIDAAYICNASSGL